MMRMAASSDAQVNSKRNSVVTVSSSTVGSAMLAMSSGFSPAIMSKRNASTEPGTGWPLRCDFATGTPATDADQPTVSAISLVFCKIPSLPPILGLDWNCYVVMGLPAVPRSLLAMKCGGGVSLRDVNRAAQSCLASTTVYQWDIARGRDAG